MTPQRIITQQFPLDLLVYSFYEYQIDMGGYGGIHSAL